MKNISNNNGFVNIISKKKLRWAKRSNMCTMQGRLYGVCYMGSAYNIYKKIMKQLLNSFFA